MNIWLSGSAQQAIIKDGKQYYLVTAGSKTAQRVREEEAAVLSQDWHDVYKLKVKTRSQANEELLRAVWCYDALLASSMAIDKNVSEFRREQAAIEANRLLQMDFASNHVLNAFCAHPMPHTADLLGARSICDRNDLPALEAIIKTVELYQRNIEAVRRAWEDIDIHFFRESAQRSTFQTAAVRAGLFASMVKRIGDKKRLEALSQSEKRAKVEAVANSQKILDDWLDNAEQYSAKPAQPIPAFTAEFAAPETPLQSRAPMAHTRVSRSISAF